MRKEDCAFISILFGFTLSIIVFILKVIYPPVLVTLPFGLILGFLALTSKRRTAAVIGIILNLVAIAGVIIKLL